MLKIAAILIMGMLTLSGCAELGARAISDATYLAESGEAYVREVHDFRRWVRETCRQMLMTEIAELQANGDTAGARQLLIDSYPGLITFQIFDDLTSEQYGQMLNYPWSCGKVTQPTVK